MMRKRMFVPLVLLLLCSFSAVEPKVSVFIAGDSTAQTYREERDGLIKGWGQMLRKFLTDDVKVVNHAIGGRSTKSFIQEGRWDRLMEEVTPGDYVFIQFGHNDASTRPDRHTSHEEYRKNLIKFVEEVRSKEATPILLTSVVMRTFDKKGNLVDDRLKAYPVITRQVAKEYKVLMIDINQKTRDFVTLLGDSASIPYYRWVEPGVDPAKPEGLKDDTHMMEKGATQVACFVAEGLREFGLKGVSEYVNLEQIK